MYEKRTVKRERKISLGERESMCGKRGLKGFRNKITFDKNRIRFGEKQIKKTRF